MEKLYLSKTCLKIADEGMHPPPPDPPLASLFNAACVPSTLVRLLYKYSSLIFVNFSFFLVVIFLINLLNHVRLYLFLES